MKPQYRDSGELRQDLVTLRHAQSERGFRRAALAEDSKSEL